MHDERLVEHVADCAHCGDILASFARIDQALQAEADCDPEVAARIKRNCNARLKAPLLVLSMASWMRVAACLLAGGVLFYAKIKFNASSGPSAPEWRAVDKPSPEVEPVGMAAAPAPAVVEPVVAAAPLPAPKVATDDAVDWRGTRLVDSGKVGVGAGPPATRPSHERIASRPEKTVADQVRHVWVVADTALPLAELKKVMPHEAGKFDRLMGEHRDRYLLQLMVSDRNLQELVDRFDKLEFKLLSPAAQQPGAKGLRYSGKSIQYEVDFVRQ